MRSSLYVLLLLGAACGCRVDEASIAKLWRPNPDFVEEVPVANLPKSMHQKNWTDYRGSGSCVHASTVYCLRWENQDELAKWWRSNHAGGETASSIIKFYKAADIPCVYTMSGNPEFLEWVTRNRYASIIWFKERHCVAFCGFAKDGSGKEVAIIQDNNRPGTYESYPKLEFIRRWRGYGGFACVPLAGVPLASIPQPSIVPKGD